MSSFLKKLVIVLAVIVFILFIALIIAVWTMGMFSPVAVSKLERGPYLAVTIAHRGSYQEINVKIEEVSKILEQKQIKHSIACGIFHDDPATVPLEDLRSQGGFIALDSVDVDSPLIFQMIPKRLVAVASIEANPAIAWFKTYPALEDWKNRNSFQTDTLQFTMEFYHPDGIVEVEMPIMPIE
jgi:DNA gyrase inhibitor GyrI